MVTKNITLYSIAAFFGAALLFSCEVDNKDIEKIAAESITPVNYIEGLELTYTDSGRVSSRLNGAVLLMEEREGEPVKNFPEGITIITYNKTTGKEEIRLVANRAIYHDKKGMAEAEGNVIVYSGENDSLTTEKLIWDRGKSIFYSDEFTKVVREGTILVGRKGFKANENFTKYEFFSSEGEINIKDSLQ